MSSIPDPTQVLIIRHGEKLGDPKKDNDGGSSLSIQGSARAAALPSLFAPAEPQLSCVLIDKPNEFIGTYASIPIFSGKKNPPRFSTPNFLFATRRSQHSDRPVETITPLAIALKLHVNDGFSDRDADIERMTTAILDDVAFAGKVVLICWHHGKIPDIAKALGVSRPPKWDGKVFDRVWQITFPKGKASLQNLPQKLLFADSSK